MNARSITRTAFTLVELLVVVVIISTLIAMILPSMRKAKLVAWQVTCSAQVRGWTQANLVYSNDNRTWLATRGPTSQALTYPNIVGSDFQTQLKNYGVGIANAFCPESSVPKTFQAGYYAAWTGTLDYTYYAYLPGTGPRVPKRATDSVDQTGRPTFVFGDVNRFSIGTTVQILSSHAEQTKPWVAYDFSYIVSGWSPASMPTPRGGNNAFIDGSTVWTPFSQLDLTVAYNSPGDSSYHWAK